MSHRERDVTRRGNVLVRVERGEDLESLEDKLDITAAKNAESRANAKGEKPIAWTKVKKALGL